MLPMWEICTRQPVAFASSSISLTAANTLLTSFLTWLLTICPFGVHRAARRVISSMRVPGTYLTPNETPMQPASRQSFASASMRSMVASSTCAYLSVPPQVSRAQVCPTSRPRFMQLPCSSI